MIEKREIEIAKELDDVMLLAVELIKTVKSKQPITQVMDELVVAIDGVTDIDDEFKANPEAFFATIGYRTGQIPAIFMKKEEVATA